MCSDIYQNPAEKPTDLSIVTVLREGIKKRLPILYSVLSVTPDLPLEKLYEEIVKCDESSLRDASSPVSASYVQAGTEELYAQFLAERKPGHVAKAKSVHWKVKGGEKKAKSRANQPFHYWNCGDEDHSARQCTQPISEKCASQLKELRERERIMALVQEETLMMILIMKMMITKYRRPIRRGNVMTTSTDQDSRVRLGRHLPGWYHRT